MRSTGTAGAAGEEGKEERRKRGSSSSSTFSLLFLLSPCRSSLCRTRIGLKRLFYRIGKNAWGGWVGG